VVAEDLRQAALGALVVDRARARERALRYTWKACTEMFLENILSARATMAEPTDRFRIRSHQP
jgi:hypothetical protein